MRPEDDTRQPEEIERDIERTREEVSSTIDAIQRKLTPGQMMDQAISYARTSLPADFGSNLGATVRENPVPVSLIGIGIAWLMMSGQNGRYAPSHVHSDMGSRTALNRRMDGPYGASFEGDSSVYAGEDGQSEGKLHQAASKIGDSSREMKSRISERGQHIRARAGDLRDRASDLGHRSQEQYYRAKDSFGHMLDEQPLVVGALGMAIGAMLGAAMPRTQREDRLMGDARDHLMEKAKETASVQAEKAKQAAEQKMDEMQASTAASADRASRSQETAGVNRYVPDGGGPAGAGSRAGEEPTRSSLH